MAARPIDIDALADLLLRRSEKGRILVAIAGAPGSGKSTVAEAVVDRIQRKAPQAAAVLPMDGFHYDDLHLVPAGLRPRKGAPETFDVGGLRHTLGRLKANEEEAVAVPVFDRSIEIARAGARLIPRSVAVVVVEGNYLLLDQSPWRDLAVLFDVTVMVQTPEAELRRRLVERWKGHGLGAEEIRRKVEENDLPNGRFVAASSAAADFVLAN